MGAPTNYQALITPLIERGVYGDIIDVTKDVDITDFIKAGGITQIKRQIDNDDYDYGVFNYGSITIKMINLAGKFNDSSDWRSVFIYSRDKAKFELSFFETDGSSAISFRGLINEEATRQDFKKNEVQFKILSRDSVIRNTKVSGGAVATGALFSTAIKTIINVPDITNILTYNPANINVAYDDTVDNGSWFDDKTTKDALDALLVVSNSTMIIDNNDNMIVRDRIENTQQIFKLYGAADIYGRNNIINIKEYNTGMHRMFNSVVFSNIAVDNPSLITRHGARQKSVSYDFITLDSKKRNIANRLLSEFQVPKRELKVIVKTSLAKNMDLYDLIAIDYPMRYLPAKGSDDLPLYGVHRYGAAKYPRAYGEVRIHPELAWKCIGIKENPKDFTTELHLRERGTTISDSMFAEFLSLYGYAVYGESSYQQDPDYIDPNQVSVYGAAKYGVVKYGLTL